MNQSTCIANNKISPQTNSTLQLNQRTMCRNNLQHHPHYNQMARNGITITLNHCVDTNQLTTSMSTTAVISIDELLNKSEVKYLLHVDSIKSIVLNSDEYTKSRSLTLVKHNNEILIQCRDPYTLQSYDNLCINVTQNSKTFLYCRASLFKQPLPEHQQFHIITAHNH